MSEADVTGTRAEGPQEVLLHRKLGHRRRRRAVRLQISFAVVVFVLVVGERCCGAEVEPLARVADEQFGFVGQAGTLVALEGRPEFLGGEAAVAAPDPRLVAVGKDGDR